jgi:putative MATE family efflux protein
MRILTSSKTPNTNYYSIKNIWLIAYPIILGSLAQDIITVVDTAFIGQLGEVQLGAAAIGGMFYLAIVMLGWGFGLGVQIIISRRYGENRIAEINQVWMHSLAILVFLSMLVFLLVRFFAFNGLVHVLSSVSVAKNSIDFLEVRIFGIFAAFININFRAFFIGTAQTKIIGLTTILMAIVNIALDYLLIFGKANFPELGMAGAALASVISEFVALVVFILYAKFSRALKPFALFGQVPFCLQTIRTIFTVSIPTMLQNFISFATWFIFFLFVERMGETPLAISNIIRSIYIVMLVPIFGFASATNSLVSYAIGKGELFAIKYILKKSIFLAVSGISVIVFVAWLIPEKIIGLYTNQVVLIEQTIPVFHTVMLASFAIAIGFVLFQTVSGTGKTQVALLIEVLVLIVYLTGVYLISSAPNAKVNHVWFVEVIYGFGLGILSVIYLKWGKWRDASII